MRYDPAFLLEWIMLRIKSKAAYDHLRLQKLLPLPCPNTIRKLLSCMTCTFGNNGYALNAMKFFLKTKPRSMRFSSLVRDEMSLAELVKFDAKKLLFEGFVDYGTAGLLLKEHKEELADHALVLIPVLVSTILVLLDSTHCLLCDKKSLQRWVVDRTDGKSYYSIGQNEVIVKLVVCDGTQSNKAMMKT